MGLEEAEDDFDFAEKFTSLRGELKQQMASEAELSERILTNHSKSTSTPINKTYEKQKNHKTNLGLSSQRRRN